MCSISPLKAVPRLHETSFPLIVEIERFEIRPNYRITVPWTSKTKRLHFVVGVSGFFNPDGSLKSVGLQCALCYSTVDNSLTQGIGHRLDGWANRDLNVGDIVSLAPNLQPFADLFGVDQPTVRKVLQSWGVSERAVAPPAGLHQRKLIKNCWRATNIWRLRIGFCEPRSKAGCNDRTGEA